MLARWTDLVDRGVVVQCWPGHASLVQGLAVVQDDRLISAGEDGWLRCWSLATGALLWSDVGHGGAAINDVVVADGQILTAGDDHRVRVWDAASGARQGMLEGHDDIVFRLAAAPDGSVVASAARDGAVRLWSQMSDGTWRCQHVLSGHSEWVAALALDPVGRRVISGALDQAIRCWSWQTGAALPALAARVGTVSWLGAGLFLGPGWSPHLPPTALCVLPDGSVVAAGERLRRWGAGGEASFAVTGQRTTSLAVVVDRLGEVLIAAAGEGLELWTPAGERLASCAVPLPLQRVVASPCGTRLCTADEAGMLAVWSVAHLREGGAPLAHEHGISSVVPGTAAVVSGERRCGRIRVWPAQTSGQGPSVLPHETDGDEARPLLAVDARRLLTMSRTAAGGRLWMWDIAAASPLWQQHLPGEPLAAASLDGDEGVVLCTDRLVSVCWSAGLGATWTGAALNLPRGPVGLAVDPTRAWVATTHRGRSPQAAGLIWKRADRTRVGVFSVPTHTSSLLCALCFSPDGVHVVGWGRDGWLHVWRRRGRRHCAAWRPHGEEAGVMVFSADEGILYTAAAGCVRAWGLSGEALGSLSLRSGRRAVFSPGGDRVAAVVREREVLLAELQTGRSASLLHTRPLAALQFSREGTHLGGVEAGGGQVSLWPLAALR